MRQFVSIVVTASILAAAPGSSWAGALAELQAAEAASQAGGVLENQTSGANQWAFGSAETHSAYDRVHAGGLRGGWGPDKRRSIEGCGYTNFGYQSCGGFSLGWSAVQTPARALLSPMVSKGLLAPLGVLLGIVLAPIALIAGAFTWITGSQGRVRGFQPINAAW